MKNILTVSLVAALLIYVGVGCKSNPFAGFTKQYKCQIDGESEPVSAEEYFRRASKHMSENPVSDGYNECAFGAVSEAIRLDPYYADAFAMRGFLHFVHRTINIDKNYGRGLQRDLESALDDLNAAIELDPDQAAFFALRGSIYHASVYLGIEIQREKALENLTTAISRADSVASKVHWLIQRGGIHFESGDYENAISDFTEAIRIDKNYVDAYSKRSEAYLRLGKSDLALKDDMSIQQLREEKAEASDSKIDDSTNDGSPNLNAIPKTIAGGVLNGKAIKLEKPAYPPAAKAVRASGSVNVKVLIDEKGDVVSASAVSGHPILHSAAVSAARASKFRPTLLSGTAVKVTGVIVFNFVLQ